ATAEQSALVSAMTWGEGVNAGAARYRAFSFRSRRSGARASVVGRTRLLTTFRETQCLQAAGLPLWIRFGGVRRQPGPSHTLDRAILVLVRRVAADADRADGGAARVEDEDSARDGDELTARGGDDGRDEVGAIAQALGDGARWDAHAESAASLALSDLHAQQSATVLALEGDQVAARVEHGDGERQEVLGTRGAKSAVNDRAGLLERETGGDVAQKPVHGATLYMVTMHLRNPRGY